MDENWGDFIDFEQDFGEVSEDYIEYKLLKEDSLAISELTSCLPSRITNHPWLLQVRNEAIYHILRTARCIGVRKITVFSAVIYLDRFLSLMEIKKEKFDPSMLLGVACLYLADEVSEDHPNLPNYEYYGQCSGKSITNMINHVKNHFEGVLTFVTPIDYINYFLSKFCTNLARKEFAGVLAVEVIMNAIRDERLMSLSAFVLAAAATLLASKPYIDNEQMIQNEINVLPLDRPIALDEMCSCYNRLREINIDRLDIIN